jgi:USP8 dimerisation domain
MTEEKKEDPHEPSAARRRQLREAETNNGSIPTVSNFFPLERYYEASDKVLQTFETAYEKKRLDEAYVYGIRFCEFCVQGIVQHDYYKSSKYAARKAQTNIRVDTVLNKLEQVADWMDKEELEKTARQEAVLRHEREERARKQKELDAKRLADIERRLAQQKIDFSRFHSQSKGENVEESAMAKLQRLSQPVTLPQAPNESQPNKRVSFQQEPDGQIFSSESGEGLPPPMLPPQLLDEIVVFPPPMAAAKETPPSYQDIIAKQSYFGPGPLGSPTFSTSAIAPSSPQAPSYDSIIKTKPTVPKVELSLRQYISQASLRYSDYLKKGYIQISALNTHQGRISGSTNGCTVISACVVSKHLQGRGVTDAEIQAVIDRDCIPLLGAIRSKLGLGGSSLIIPSDVHDYMVDHKLLYQHKFVGASGGNICDQSHVQEVYKMLAGDPGKTQHLKAGATLFFKEHVISIVKFPTSPTEAVYDMVDSLPTVNGRASRTRCNSIKALKVLLEWYTSHKFSDSNITYMERNRWDDSMADFDPRVFQAFVWADLPKAT